MTRSQRLIDEFEEGSAFTGGFSIRHGIAAVLEHICSTEDDISPKLLSDLAESLTAPTTLERALAGDATAARQFLYQAGFTDQQGQWLSQYQPYQ